MKRIAKFVADDGSEFTTEEGCIAYEAMCAEVSEVMSTLPRLPDGDDCKFANGGGYFQHDEQRFSAARLALLKIAKRTCAHRWLDEAIDNPKIHPSYPGRLISEMSKPLSHAWYRFMCTDSELREWGQPYYATHQGEAEQVRLN